MFKQIFSATLLALGPVAAGGGTPSSELPATMGLEFVNPEELNRIQLAELPFSGSRLPKTADLSEHMPTPGFQGRQNSCVAWVSAYALKTYQEKLEQRYELMSSGQPDMKRIFSPAFVYNQINQGRDSGATLVDALNLLSDRGALSWSEMPYDVDNFTRRPSPKQLKSAQRYRIAYWRKVNVADAQELKAQLHAGYPIMIGAVIDESLFKLKAGRIWERSSGKSLGGHALIVVGYDEHRKAFKVMNSWGSRWADRGFGWISYRQFARVVREGYVAKDAVNDRPLDMVNRIARHMPLSSRANIPEQPGHAEADANHEGEDIKTADARKPSPEVQPASPIVRPAQIPEAKPSPKPTAQPSTEPSAEPTEQLTDLTPTQPSDEIIMQSEEHVIEPISLTQQRIEKGELIFSGQAETLGEGKQAQILVRFYRDAAGSKPLIISDTAFTLPDGSAVAISPVQTVSNSSLSWEAKIPLKLLPSGKVWAQPVLYLDQFGVDSGQRVLVKR